LTDAAARAAIGAELDPLPWPERRAVAERIMADHQVGVRWRRDGYVVQLLGRQGYCKRSPEAALDHWIWAAILDARAAAR